MDLICELFGKTRQAYYQRIKYEYKEQVKESIIVSMVQEIRTEQPRIGGRKLLELIIPKLQGDLNIGRDAFFDLLGHEGLLVRKSKRRAVTTNSKHWLRMYKNLIRGFNPTAAHQLWVSDITYIDTIDDGFMYLFLITDAYSRKIVGWCLSKTLEAENALTSLYMAISQLPANVENLIHHSDRGVQYCSNKYVKQLESTGIRISMTENGDPRENAIAERVNGILKTEWLYCKSIKNKHDALVEVNHAIKIYNEKRPHSSINMLTPEQAHLMTVELKKRWKNYYRENYLKRKELEKENV
jgi:transposase InsO family protein